MSYEGYSQNLCSVGHLTILDCNDSDVTFCYCGAKMKLCELRHCGCDFATKSGNKKEVLCEIQTHVKNRERKKVENRTAEMKACPLEYAKGFND